MINNNFILEKVKKFLEFGKKYKIPFRIRVSVFIIKDNKILLGYNPFSETSKYLIPGGEVTKNIKESAKKEAEEELGVKIKNIKLLPKIFFYLFPDMKVNSENYTGTIGLFCLADYDGDAELSNPEFDYIEEDILEAIKKIKSGIFNIKNPRDLWIRSLIDKEAEVLEYIYNNNIVNKRIEELENKKNENKLFYTDTRLFHFDVRVIIKTDKEEIPPEYKRKIDWLKNNYDNMLSYVFEYLENKKIIDFYLNEDDFKTFIEPNIISFYSNTPDKILILFNLPIRKFINKFITIFINRDTIKNIGLIDKNVFLKKLENKNKQKQE